MPRVVSSEVMALIDRLFPWAAEQHLHPEEQHQMDYGSLTSVAPVVDAVERIPDELITLQGELAAGF